MTSCSSVKPLGNSIRWQLYHSGAEFDCSEVRPHAQYLCDQYTSSRSSARWLRCDQRWFVDTKGSTWNPLTVIGLGFEPSAYASCRFRAVDHTILADMNPVIFINGSAVVCYLLPLLQPRHQARTLSTRMMARFGAHPKPPSL